MVNFDTAFVAHTLAEFRDLQIVLKPYLICHFDNGYLQIVLADKTQ